MPRKQPKLKKGNKKGEPKKLKLSGKDEDLLREAADFLERLKAKSPEFRCTPEELRRCIESCVAAGHAPSLCIALCLATCLYKGALRPGTSAASLPLLLPPSCEESRCTIRQYRFGDPQLTHVITQDGDMIRVQDMNAQAQQDAMAALRRALQQTERVGKRCPQGCRCKPLEGQTPVWTRAEAHNVQAPFREGPFVFTAHGAVQVQSAELQGLCEPETFLGEPVLKPEDDELLAKAGELAEKFKASVPGFCCSVEELRACVAACLAKGLSPKVCVPLCLAACILKCAAGGQAFPIPRPQDLPPDFPWPPIGGSGKSSCCGGK